MASFQAPIFSSKKFFVPSVSDEVDLAKQKINQATFDVKQAAGKKPEGADLYAVGPFKSLSIAPNLTDPRPFPCYSSASRTFFLKTPLFVFDKQT